MEELWKDIVGFEGLYKISNLGRVMSCRSANHKDKKPIIMKPSVSNTGYHHVQLYKNKKAYTMTIHRMVATAFIDNPSNKPEVNHIDGIKSHNAVDNLEWVTIGENQRHAIKLGLRSPSPMTGRKGKESPTSKSVIQYTLDGEFVRVWYCISDAARALNCHTSAIGLCLSGRNITGAGYMWRELKDDTIPQKISPSRNRNHAKAISVIQLSMSNEIIKSWNSLYSASKETGNTAYSIRLCCQGTLESLNGYKWKFANPHKIVEPRKEQ
jgi:hypothetical protein